MDVDQAGPQHQCTGGAALVELGREVLRIETDAVLALAGRLGEQFFTGVNLVLACQGRVIVTGMGKSGHVARKIAATMASTGTPAFFVHPAEASHGNLGMITPDDVVITVSNSGETVELVAIVPMLKRQGARLIAITGAPNSTLARYADVHLDAGVERQACPLGLAPTASTAAALALSDALSVAVLKARGFGADDFARSHPGGKLGRRLHVHVQKIMHSGDRLPRVARTSSLVAALLVMQSKGCNEQIPANIYEYLRAGRPTLCLSDPAGDTVGVLRQAGLYAGARLPAFLDAVRSGQAELPDAEVVRSTSRRVRSEALARMLDDVCR